MECVYTSGHDSPSIRPSGCQFLPAFPPDAKDNTPACCRCAQCPPVCCGCAPPSPPIVPLGEAEERGLADTAHAGNLALEQIVQQHQLRAVWLIDILNVMDASEEPIRPLQLPALRQIKDCGLYYGIISRSMRQIDVQPMFDSPTKKSCVR